MDSVQDTACAVGFPIRRPADQRALAPPRSFSQRATSFIASWRQGIHQMPLPKRLIAKPVARRDKPRSQQVSHEDALLALERHALITPRTSPSSHSPGKARNRPQDGNAALPDTPSSPCQRSLRSPRANLRSTQTLLHPIVRRSPCCCRLAPSSAALFCIRRSRGAPHRCRARHERCCASFGRWWR